VRPAILRSLTVRTALSFALVACVVVSGLGVYLYLSVRQAMESQADHALIGRIERFRGIVRDLYNIRQMEDRPALFETMLDNEQDVRIFRRVGEAPFIQVNPSGMMPPGMAAVPVDQPVTPDALTAGTRADGVRVRWVRALASPGAAGKPIEITVAYVMTRESQMLAAYRLRVAGAILLAVLLTALMGILLLRRGLRPLQTLSREAGRISPAHLALRLSGQDAPSELQSLVQAVNVMLDRLQAGYEHLSQFSADLAHELRTPVHVLMGQTQVALGQARSRDEYEQVLESNLEEFARLAHIIENILFLSRADQDAVVAEREPLDLSVELHRIADYFEGLALERDMRFEVQASGVAQASPVMWRRAVNNLVINAIRYGDEHSVIRLIASSTPEASTVVIENRGRPLSQDALDRMFSRFYRGDQSRSAYTESNGLGLALVKAIMAIHRGSARARVTDEGWIRFELRFPAA